jgi:hypothetical protein
MGIKMNTAQKSIIGFLLSGLHFMTASPDCQAQQNATINFTTSDASMWSISGGGATNATPSVLPGLGISIKTDFCSDNYVAGVTGFTGFWLADFVFFLPSGATNVSINFTNLYFDDRGLLLLNGTPMAGTGIYAPGEGTIVLTEGGAPQPFYFSGQDPSGGRDAILSGSISSGFITGGYNTMRLIINNTGSGIAGSLSSESCTRLVMTGSVSYSDVTPHTATATAVYSLGAVAGINVIDPGYGYTNVPLVRIIGDGGGAQAVAVVSNGIVTSINVTNSGYGYNNAPLVVIDPPYIPNPILAIAPFSLLSFSNLTVGAAYQLQSAYEWYWSNQPVSFTATNVSYTQMVVGVASSGDYRLALNPVPAQAFAVPQMVNGFVVGATVTSGGSGYVSSPVVTIAGGGGTNATAVSQISGGVVTNISITSAGIGYTNTPNIEIAQPPAAAVFPTALPMMQIYASALSPYDNYQIQFRPTLDNSSPWQNWNGGLFSPTSKTNSQMLFITNGAGFFRLQYVP